MRERTDPPKARKAPKNEQKADRLAAALRANLAPRKAQKRARDTAAEGDKEQG